MGTDIDTLTGETVELLQQLIRNQCVNDGTPESGNEVLSAELLRNELEGLGLDFETVDSLTVTNPNGSFTLEKGAEGWSAAGEPFAMNSTDWAGVFDPLSHIIPATFRQTTVHHSLPTLTDNASENHPNTSSNGMVSLRSPTCR